MRRTRNAAFSLLVAACGVAAAQTEALDTQIGDRRFFDEHLSR